MTKLKFICFTLFLLVLPLILSGCFNNQPSANVPEPVSYSEYTQNSIEQAGYKVKYPSTWLLEESVSGRFADKNDTAIFKLADNQQITVGIFPAQDLPLKDYVIENESQTQINGRLANDYLVKNPQAEDKRLRLITVINGNYLYLLESNAPGAESFDEFLNNFSFLDIKQEEPGQPIKQFGKEVHLKLYFDDLSKENNNDCSADGYQEVIAIRPDVEIGLIPLAIQSLLQVVSSPELAEQQLSSNIPINTRLLSFGYEHNTAFVNFNATLNEGGGSCAMFMRRSQIEQTLKALNQVSNLQIKFIEIQVEGGKEEVLQP